jgi:hypothetical protein
MNDAIVKKLFSHEDHGDHKDKRDRFQKVFLRAFVSSCEKKTSKGEADR